jgi:DNA-binding response OmpR family regulator
MPKKRILVVEDDAALARVLREDVDNDEVEVEWVANGAEAGDRARAFAPDLVLLVARGVRGHKANERLARVQAVLRRARPSVPSVDDLTLGPTVVNFQTRVARRDGRDLRLTHREFEILRYLAERPARVVHRDELLREVWGYPDVPATRSVDHAIARLRKKIEADPHQPRFIHTAQGSGYRLTPNGVETAKDGGVGTEDSAI